MSLRKAVKDVLDSWNQGRIIPTTNDGFEALQELRQALAEPYKPMDSDEWQEFAIKNNLLSLQSGDARTIEAAVLARMGIEVKP